MRLLVRGRTWRVDAVTSGKDCDLLRLVELGGERGKTFNILTPFDRPRSLERARSLQVVRPRRWLHDLDRSLLDLHPFGALRAAARSSIDLLPYQLEPALAILGGLATRVLIADGVGLGKTVQAGLILQELARDRETFRALVLVPAGLRDQWTSELQAHFSLSSTRADAAWLRSCQTMLPPDVNPWSLPGLYIASHDFVKRPESLKPLEQVWWSLVVVDEAHAATSLTDRRAAIDAIASRAERVLLLTATPRWGDETEFPSLCRIGRLDEAESRVLVFARSRSDVGAGVARRTVVLPVPPSEAESRMHQLLTRYSAELWREATARRDEAARLASIILRKRALSSAASLAASVRRRLTLLSAVPTADAAQLQLPLLDEDPLPDDEPSHELAAPGLSDVRRETRWLQAIAEAAGTAARAETKARRLVRLLNRVREPVIVFTEYRDTLERLRHRIAATGRKVAVLHGGLGPAERGRVPSLLETGDIVLLATDAASEGLNLHRHCRVVVHYELPWHPLRLEQRAGRVDRIGQSKRVHEIALVAAATAERLVIAPLTLRASRSGSRGSGRFGAALTESRVTREVMGHPACASAGPERTTNEAEEMFELQLRAQAEAEASRIERLRALIARSETAGRNLPGRPPATVFPGMRLPSGSRSEDAVVVVYSIGLDDPGGGSVHGEIVSVRFSIPGTARRRKPAELRSLLSPFTRPEVWELIPPLQEALKGLGGTVSTLARRVHEVLEDRRRLMVRQRSSARELVQPQLFRRRPKASSITPADPSTGGALSLAPRAALLGAIVLTRR